MTILFFAQARELAQCTEIIWEVAEPQSSDSLWSWLLAQFPDLGPMRATSKIACNESYHCEGEWIQPGDIVAIIPPVSGG